MNFTKLRTSVSAIVGKAILFLVVAGLLSGAEHLMLVWVHPRGAAELGVRQFEPSNSVVESLRSYEFAKNVGMTIRNAAIAVFGLALFGSHAGTALDRLAYKGDPQ